MVKNVICKLYVKYVNEDEQLNMVLDIKISTFTLQFFLLLTFSIGEFLISSRCYKPHHTDDEATFK